MTEYNPEDGTAFGKVILQEEELGYFSIPELESVRLWGGLFIERDIYFTPKPLKDCD
jgi:hypothetical protein